MKKYIIPELEIVNFECEDIVTTSAGYNLLTVDGSAEFANGSLEFTDNN